MLQNGLLLTEITILVIIVTSYVLNRRLVSKFKISSAEIQGQTTEEIARQHSVQEQAMTMVRDLAALLADVQAIADKTKADFSSRETSLQQLLTQTDQVHEQYQSLAAQTETALTIQGELQTLLDQAKVSFTACDELQALVKQAEAAVMVRNELRILLDQANAVPTANGQTTFTPVQRAKNPSAIQPYDSAQQPGLAKVLPEFRKHLHAKGYSQSTVASLMAQVRHFVTWLGGKRYTELPLAAIKETEISSYEAHLKKQKLRAATIKRKLMALRTFHEWVDSQLALMEETPEPASKSLVPVASPASGTSQPEMKPWPALAASVSQPGADLRQPALLTEGTYPDQNGSGPAQQIAPHDKTVWNEASSARPPRLITGQRNANTTPYQVVLALASQGVDRTTIASKTGLEQESIRMLLARQESSEQLVSMSAQSGQ